MARNQINLNRFRKIYPQLRKSPHWWTRSTGAIEAITIDVGNGDSLTQLASLNYSAPVAVATADENVNVWVNSINYNSSNQWEITVAVSDSSFTGKIYLHLLEGNP